MIRAGVVVVAAALVACNASPRTFTSESGRFSVLFPTKPMEIGPSVSTAGDTSYNFAAELDGAMYSVGFTDYRTAPADAATFLREQRDEAMKRAPGKILLDRTATLSGSPGLEFRVEYPSGSVGHTRVFLSGRRLYQQVAFGYLNEAFTRQFMESLVLR